MTAIISVIICTHNRAQKVIKTIYSLLDQKNISSNDYEIIIVDDNSTDSTKKILSRYDVKLISTHTNKGISFVRNLGLSKASGKIIVYIDDDCIASPYLLHRLREVFNLPNVIAVGGKINIRGETIASKYLHDSGYGDPCPLFFKDTTSMVQRFILYLKQNFKKDIKYKKVNEVLEIYSANAAYLKRALLSINGFDVKLRSGEDTDISYRLKQQYPLGKILFATDAIVHHNDSENLIDLTIKRFFRSKDLLRLYSKKNKFPPVFPIPLLYLIICIYLFLYYSPSGLLITLIPIILYPWWFIKMFTVKKIRYLLYPYIQLTLELATLMGIIYFFIINENND